MSIPFDTLLQEALLLPLKERSVLAKTLTESLEEEDEPDEVRAAWIEEIEHRFAAFERGEVKAMPGEEVMAALKKQFSL